MCEVVILDEMMDEVMMMGEVMVGEVVLGGWRWGFKVGMFVLEEETVLYGGLIERGLALNNRTG